MPMIQEILSIVYMSLMRTTENISKKKKKIILRPLFDAEENSLMRAILYWSGEKSADAEEKWGISARLR